MKLSAAGCCNPRSLINQFVSVTDNQEFCMETTLLCIDTPGFDSILYHLGKLVLQKLDINQTMRY